jgi:hypothetical protein
MKNLSEKREELAMEYAPLIKNVRIDNVAANSGFKAGFDAAVAECHAMLEQMAGALEKINAMNYQTAIDQYGDKNKAESWACVRVANEALAEYRKWKGEGCE